jgi:hypothetical protein
MFNNYKKGLALLATGIVTTMAGCQKEEEPLDLEVPAVTLEISGNPAKLYNETILSVTATDNDGVDRVVFYVNSDSIGQAVEEPYELKWNTKNVEDGRHMLKATAYDASGNKTEAAKEVTIKNTLFIMHVEDGYMQTTENRIRNFWVFLSDKNGNLIGEAQEIVNGENLKWERPSGYDTDTVYVNRFYYYKYTYPWTEKSYEYLRTYTYTDVTLEEANLRAYHVPDSIGKVDITVENDFNGFDDFAYETEFPYYSGYSYTNSNTTTYTVSMEQNSQKGFSTYENHANITDQNLRERFYRMDELQAGNSYSFHTNEYTPMEGKTVNIPFSYDYIGINTYGYLNGDERGYYLDWTSVHDNQSPEIKALYANDFSIIETRLNGRTGNKSFFQSIMGKAPDAISIPDYSLSLESEKQKTVKVVSSQGTFDVGNGSWAYEENNETRSLSVWRGIYFSNKTGASYVLPEIPANLLELYPALNQPLEYNGAWMLDIKLLSTYDEILKYWFTDKYSSKEYGEFSSLTIYPENTGGRILASQSEKSSKKKMEEESLQARGIFSH